MIRRIARPMLASVFIVDGVETLRNPQPHIEQAEPLVEQAAPLVEKGEKVIRENVSESVPSAPKQPETLVRALAVAKIGAGTMFALGKLPRTSAAVLTAAHVPSTVARHSFWLESDPAERSRKTKGLAGDVALVGALILATADTAGKPGLAYRAGKARDKVVDAFPGQSETEKYKEQVSDAVHSASDQAKEYVSTAREKAPEVAESVKAKAPEVADDVKTKAPVYLSAAVAAAKKVGERVAEQAGQARKAAEPYVEGAKEKAAEAREAAEPYVEEAKDKATEKAAEARKAAAPYVDDAKEKAADTVDKAADLKDDYAPEARKRFRRARKSVEKSLQS